jgi:hypothetical protein
MRFVIVFAVLALTGCTMRHTTVDSLGETAPDGCVWIAAQDARQTVVLGLHAGRQVTRSSNAVYLCCPSPAGPVCEEAEWQRVPGAPAQSAPEPRPAPSPANAGQRTDLKGT